MEKETPQTHLGHHVGVVKEGLASYTPPKITEIAGVFPGGCLNVACGGDCPLCLKAQSRK